MAIDNNIDMTELLAYTTCEACNFNRGDATCNALNITGCVRDELGCGYDQSTVKQIIPNSTIVFNPCQIEEEQTNDNNN